MNNLSQRRSLLIFGSIIAGALVTIFITRQVAGGSFDRIAELADWQNILLVNILIGLSIVLFMVELRIQAARVILTVIIALFFGFLVTMIFTLDTADQYTRGEFRVKIISEAEPVENDGVDLEYGQQRGGEFNKPNASEPLTDAAYTFAGRQGDVITILAFAANRRSTVDMQLALLNPDGEALAESFEATAEQVEEKYDDLVSENDAVIEAFVLPADGVYTVAAKPEDLGFNTIITEAIGQTRKAYDSLLFGPIDRVNRWAIWIQDAITLILLGLSFAIVFRARQFSLGAEGQLYFGALISGIIALNFGHVPGILLIPLILLSASTAGFLWGLLPGALKAYLGANELVSTLMLNTIAVRFYEMVLNFQLKPPDAGYIVTDRFSANAILPSLVENTQVTIAVFVLAVAILLSWLLMRRTPIGYEIRMVGSNIKFSGYGGINTRRTVMLVMAIAGILGGLAGAHLAVGIHRQLVVGISFGLAFEGVVVALLARNNVLVVPFAGLLYAYLRAGAQFMERDANVSFEIVRMIQAIIILLITAEAMISFVRQRRVDAQKVESSGDQIQIVSSGQTATQEAANV